MPPSILAVIPPSGPTTGGNPVLLLGVGLNNATSVTFGGTPATILGGDPYGFLLVVVAPPHAAGTVPVVVTTPVGVSAPGNYTYVVLTPTAASIVPTSGPTTGGTAFTITGTNLAGATVTFNGVPATGVTVNAAGTVITGVTPPGAAGLATVLVTTPGGTATVPGGFTYVVPPPTVTILLPTTGPVAGGQAFVITGTNLTGATVTFGGTPATGVSVGGGGTVLVGLTPAHAAGNVPVVVTTPGGTATVVGGYTYV
jgi:hypothetical protein